MREKKSIFPNKDLKIPLFASLNCSVNLPSVNELSQMFPTLDGELGSVANHFRFDHLVATEENGDLNDQKTPLQNDKQFPTASNEQAVDEEDDDPTISTDYLTSQNDPKSIPHQISEGVISTATKLLEDIINNSEPRHPPETIAEAIKHAPTRHSNLQMQKQFSMHGSESASSIGSLRQIPNITSDSSRFPRRNIEYSRFMSVDQRSISDTEDNVVIESGCMQNKENKTQSCANISCTAPRSPGAIVVKEKYIELPKQMAHMAKSPSKDCYESVEGSKNSTSLTSSSESVSRLSKTERTKPRFTTTKVDESVLKEV